MRTHKSSILILTSLFLFSILLFLFYGVWEYNAYIFQRRLIKILAIIAVGCSIAYSTVIFQTLSNNRILSPSVMGFESVYLFFQSILVFIYGDKTFQVLKEGQNFLYSVLFMMGFAVLLYYFMFRKNSKNLYLLLLVGLTFGIIFNMLSSFIQIVLDPNEFSVLQTKLYASFNSINSSILSYAISVLGLAFILSYPRLKYLDILALGRENAINLGVNYHGSIQFFLLISTILVAVSTALVGPIIFLGILVSNLTYKLVPTHKHSKTLFACCLISCIALLGGQFVVEHFFNFSVSTSTIINLIGGLYFLFILLKTQQK